MPQVLFICKVIIDTEDDEEETDVSTDKETMQNIHNKLAEKKFDTLPENKLQNLENIPKLNFYSLNKLPMQKVKKHGWDYSKSVQFKYSEIPKFLIVEDQVDVRIEIRKVLQMIKIPILIDSADNGREAVEKFKRMFNSG